MQAHQIILLHYYPSLFILCVGGSKEPVVRMYNLVIVKYGECGKRRVGLFVIWIIKFQQVSVCSTKFLSMSGVMSLEI